MPKTPFLWAVAAAIILTWILAYASISYQNAMHNPVIYHYKYKVCPAPTGGTGGR